MKRFWPLLIPLTFGLIVVIYALAGVAYARDGTELEGAFGTLALGGMMYSLFAFPATTILLMVLVRRSPVSYPAYAGMLFISTLPVAYFQAVNMQSSFMEHSYSRSARL
ncbi:MAG TPA: hypothetical protein VFN37_06795 [Candidatus Baltobacteraceae bacterium]|nr:hypothetical protein [Candidatus Baltobacteraceae bacterium]